ncbi:hypothetical protein V1508DRAFT_432365 [Lipomyces doorenjongii]|uniref:uncharacterized protein n=1 Tax=Lipomyces doorenjongii TaxID=383834 RepID=UPI0034D0005D
MQSTSTSIISLTGKRTLFSLPTEVVATIISYIYGYDDLVALSLTCKHASSYYDEETVYMMKVHRYLRSHKMEFYSEYKDRLNVKTWKEGYENLLRNMQLYEIISFCVPLETGGHSLVASSTFQ